MKRKVSNLFFVMILTMTMVIGMTVTVFAAAPDGTSLDEAACTEHPNVNHVYSFGTTFGDNQVNSIIYYFNPVGDYQSEVYKSNTDSSNPSVSANNFDNETYTEGWYYVNNNKYYLCSGHGTTPAPIPVAESITMAPAMMAIDRDTFKSEAPAETVMVADGVGASSLFDLKVHATDERTNINQKFLAQYLVGPTADVLLTQNIYPRRDLTMAEDGATKTLTWNNLPKYQAGPVYAVIYNEIDGAYVLNGILDANGTAVFNSTGFYGFKLRNASTITICRIQ